MHQQQPHRQAVCYDDDVLRVAPADRVELWDLAVEPLRHSTVHVRATLAGWEAVPANHRESGSDGKKSGAGSGAQKSTSGPEAADGELLGSEAAELVALEVTKLLLPDAWVCAAHPRESVPQAESGQQEPEWGSQVGRKGVLLFSVVTPETHDDLKEKLERSL